LAQEKSRPQQEFVVGGFTEGKGSRKHLGALLLGAYRNGQLHYFGHSGSGFSEKGLRDALDRMKPLFTDKSPFENPPRIPEKIQWVKPKLVCEISFVEWTRDGELRQTVFIGPARRYEGEGSRVRKTTIPKVVTCTQILMIQCPRGTASRSGKLTS
jgi:ATP-dependent DNA ligase